MKNLKRNYRINILKKNQGFLITGIVFLCVLILTIGWSAYLQELYIDDISLNIESKQDIRITGLTVMKENTASIGNFIYDYDRIIADGIQLSNKNDHIIFDVEITNFENAEMGILKIDGLPDDLELVIDLENPKTCYKDDCILEEKVCS